MNIPAKTAARQEAQPDSINLTVIERIGFGKGQLHALDQSAAELEQFGETLTSSFLKKVTAGAAGCCMDGRICNHTVAGTAPTLGPKCAGGPLQTAFAAAEVIEGYYGHKSGASSSERIVEVGEILTVQGIMIGGHTTDGAVANHFINPKTGQEQTGCGAEEKHPASTQAIVKRDTNVVKTADLLLGAHQELQTVTSETLTARNADYSPKAMLEVVRAQNGGKNTEVLEGSHEELVIVWNKVRGYTIDRDELIRQSGKEVFIIDAWYIEDIAKAMAIDHLDASEMYKKVLRAAVEYQLATYGELGDGSHPVLVLESAA